MTADELARKLLALQTSPQDVVLVVVKKGGGFMGFEPAGVYEENGVAIVILDPVEIETKDGSTDSWETCGYRGSVC